jgi:hypothetical protein
LKVSLDYVAYAEYSEIDTRAHHEHTIGGRYTLFVFPLPLLMAYRRELERINIDTVVGRHHRRRVHSPGAPSISGGGPAGAASFTNPRRRKSSNIRCSATDSTDTSIAAAGRSSFGS